MPFYELVYIVRPDVATTQVDQITSKVVEHVKKNGGKVSKTEQWGLRNLAYKIKKHKKGYYTMLSLDMPGAAVTPIEHQLKLMEDVIRFHTISVEKMDDKPSIVMKHKAKSYQPTEAAAPAKSQDQA